MSQTLTPLAALRTYAADVARERSKHGDTTPTPNLPQPPARVPAAPSEGTMQAHISNLAAGVLTEEKREDISTFPKINLATTDRERASVQPPRPSKPEPLLRDTVVTIVPPVAPAQTSIPPYHALKKINLADANTAGIIINDDESGAMIITDTKRNRFTLFSGIIAAMRGWFKEKAVAQEKKRDAKNVMPETTRRSAVIQRATTHTALGTISNPTLVREQVRQRLVEDVVEKLPPLPDAPTIVPPSTITNVVTTSRASTPPPEAAVSDDDRWNNSSIPRPKPAPDTPIPAPATVVRTPQQTPISVPDQVITTTPTPRRTRLTVAITAIILTLVVAIGAVGVFYGPTLVTTYLQPNTGTITVVENVVRPSANEGTVLRIPALIITTAPGNAAELFSTLTGLVSTSTLLKEISFMSDFDDTTPANLISLIDPAVDQNLAQAISVLVFGWVDPVTPFMVLRVTDRTTALGGLLRSENSLYQGLSPLYVSGTSINPVRVIDRTILGNDVRVFIRPDGSESLVYGFTDANTIIVTSNTTAFLSLTALVQTR